MCFTFFVGFFFAIIHNTPFRPMFAYFFSFFQTLPEKFAKFLELMLHFIPFHFISVNVIPITVAVHTTYSILCSKTKATPKILFIFRDSIHFVCKFLFWVFNLIFFFSLHSSFFVVCVFFVGFLLFASCMRQFRLPMNLSAIRFICCVPDACALNGVVRVNSMSATQQNLIDECRIYLFCFRLFLSFCVFLLCTHSFGSCIPCER